MKRLIGFLIAFLIISSIAAAHTVTLTWSPSTDGAANPTSGYNVQRGTTSGGEGSANINASPVAAGCTSTTNCTYTDSSSAVVAGATLYYTVTFQVGAVTSKPSNEASAGVPVAPPSGVTATPN